MKEPLNLSPTARSACCGLVRGPTPRAAIAQHVAGPYTGRTRGPRRWLRRPSPPLLLLTMLTLKLLPPLLLLPLVHHCHLCCTVEHCDRQANWCE